MIQIIKKGKVDTYITLCPYCGCIFTYQKDEIYYPDLVTCPMDGCHNTIATNRTLSSEEVLEELKLNA